MPSKLKGLLELLQSFKEFAPRKKESHDMVVFLQAWWKFLSEPTQGAFFKFEGIKKKFAEVLYRQRGKFARPFIHSGMVAISAMGVMLAPIVSDQFPGGDNPWLIETQAVLSATTENPATITQESNKYRDDIYEHSVQSGETLSQIAEKFGVSQDTIVWQNKLDKKKPLKEGQKLEILPVTGIMHKVEKGETIYSIAKKYDAEPQAIVVFPFNTFVNDETFALAVGQKLVVPDGTPPQETAAPRTFAKRLTPDAGTVTASGSFVWPTSGTISQGFSWYHSGIDIANRASPDILAVDSGTVISAGWPDNSGYGNRVVLDHGNGLQTLYAHLSQVSVVVGQTVRRGDILGRMGTTGRSTGIHLHFEVRSGGARNNPMNYLQ